MVSFPISPLIDFSVPTRWQLSTISDVARQAGVSTVTVSRVLNNAPNVNQATRHRVEQAIQELGYVPDVAARSLRSKRTRSLALILPDITNSFWTTVARGVEDAAQSSGYAVLLCNTDENRTKQARYLDLVASRRVDGVIIAPFDSNVQNIRTLRDREIATVLVDRRIEGWETDSVRGDSVGGAQALVRHLIGLGHTRIAMISGPADTSTAQDRVEGYRAALMGAGIDPNPALIRQGEFRASSGEQLLGQLLDEGLRPTATFAANNAIAMGVIDAVARRGRRIPHDLALVCFDDFDAASHLFPFLTVAVQPAYEMGVRAAQLLLSRVETGATLAPRHILLPVRLIIRHSCGSHLQDGGHSELALPLEGMTEARTVLVEPASFRVPGSNIGE
jgi:LacI family transcriptional regulator